MTRADESPQSRRLGLNNENLRADELHADWLEVHFLTMLPRQLLRRRISSGERAATIPGRESVPRKVPLMTPWSLVKSVAALGIVAFLAGCGSNTPAPAPAPQARHGTGESPSPVEPTTVKPAPAKEPQVKPEATVKIEDDSAAAAVIKTLRALQAGNLGDAYDFLPPPYQADIDGLVHEFAAQMDPEVWSRMLETSRKAVKLLSLKKDSILALDLFRDQPDVEAWRKQWDSTTQLLTTLANSDATNLSKLKELELRSLMPDDKSLALPQFKVIGLALGANLAHQFADVSVAPVRVEGDEHVVALRGPNDEQSTEIVYVKHEGHWLPKSLVENWDAGIKSDREWLAKLPERVKAIKPQLLDALSNADEILDQLLAAENREQFEQAAGPAILSLSTAWPKLQGLARQAMTGATEPLEVTISINRELTDAELTKLVDAVLKPLGESGSDYTLLANDGRTICHLSKVSDVAPLKASLVAYFNIPADDVQAEPGSSVIKVELAP